MRIVRMHQCTRMLGGLVVAHRGWLKRRTQLQIFLQLSGRARNAGGRWLSQTTRWPVSFPAEGIHSVQVRAIRTIEGARGIIAAIIRQPIRERSGCGQQPSVCFQIALGLPRCRPTGRGESLSRRRPSTRSVHSPSGSMRRSTPAFLACAVLLGGCAIQYYDPETGINHVWGLGHMSMKMSPPNEGLQAVVRATSVLGLSMGRTRDRTYLMLGYDSEQQTDIVAENTSVRLEWPASDLFNLQVGSNWPATRSGRFYLNREEATKTPGTKEDD